MPWFSGGIHPRIEELRRALAPRCLYHTFPSGEPWDFILPGTPAEIGGGAVDYGLVRRPKFEVVSFDRCSRPILQIDIGCDRSLTELQAVFPEALVDHAIGNAWIYVDGPLGLDLCLVMGPQREEARRRQGRSEPISGPGRWPVVARPPLAGCHLSAEGGLERLTQRAGSALY